MKKILTSILRRFISPSMRFKLRSTESYFKELLNTICFWHWEVVKLPPINSGYHQSIIYAGRKKSRGQAMALLGLDSNISANNDAKKLSTILISELPVPSAFCVPKTLSTVVPLGRPLEEITASYDSELRRLIHKQRLNYSTQHVQQQADIARIESNMLKPYATARHDNSAVQLESAVVHKMALPMFGQLDIIFANNEEVACHLGCILIRGGKRYWSTVRFGYPEAVFSDRKRLREVNAMTTYLALEWALDNGFDYYDIGMSLARPDGGLLQWKRRRKGNLDTLSNHGYFYVRLPKLGSAQFLWHAPLFAVERGSITLHLGVPETKTDEEIAARYREMGYGGLSKIYLHSERLINDVLVEKFRGIYSLQKIPPIIEIVFAN